MGTLVLGFVIAGSVVAAIYLFFRYERTVGYVLRLIFLVGFFLIPIFLLGLLCVTYGAEHSNPWLVALGLLVDLVVGLMIWLHVSEWD